MSDFPDDVLELVKPAIFKRVEELIESAFKLASFSNNIEIIEKSIDACTKKFFPDGNVEEVNPQGVGILNQRVGKNIVVQRTNYVDSSLPNGSISKKYERIKAHRRGKNGYPLSVYHGVTFSKNKQFPWLCRYATNRIGVYKTEEEAGRAYDRCLIKEGMAPRNFKDNN